jgi:uncharacterized membrane protein
MEAIIEWLKTLQLHPVADHFTIALLATGVLLDLAASFAPSRIWLRYAALTLMILGASAAAASFYTGHWDAERVEKFLSGTAKDALEWHEDFGHWILYTFIAIAVWRLAIQAFEFVARTRQIYLAVAVLAVIALFLQGHWGGELVYTFGIGTELLKPSTAPSPGMTPSGPTSPEWTLPPAPSASAQPTPIPSAAATQTTGETPTAGASPSPPPAASSESSPTAETTPSASPTATPPPEAGV